MGEILAKEFFGNTVQAYAIALGAIILGYLIITLVLRTIAKYGEADVYWKKYIRKFISPTLFIGLLYVSISTLTFSKDVMKVVQFIFILLATYLVVRFIIVVLDFIIKRSFEVSKDEGREQRIKPILSFVNFLIWIIGILFILDNLGIQISTIVAGLGIGGIAVAFAAQALLSDLFSYFVINFDRPYTIGDFVIFEDKVGTIEKIGIKSTRVRALSGEMIVVSNTNLLNMKLHNYKTLEKRRVVFSLGVIYGTPSEKLKRIPDMIKSIIAEHEKAEVDRSHFKTYGSFSLDFETVYYIYSSDYVEYMDIQQAVNLAIYEAFEKEGIEFAYPTQTLFINKEG